MRHVLFDMSTGDAVVDMLIIFTNFLCKERT